MAFGPCIYRRGTVLRELDCTSVRFYGFDVCWTSHIRRGACFVSHVFTHRFLRRSLHVHRSVFVFRTSRRFFARVRWNVATRTFSFSVSAGVFLSSRLTCVFFVPFECFELLLEQFVIQVRVGPFRLCFGGVPQQLSKLHGILFVFLSFWFAFLTCVVRSCTMHRFHARTCCSVGCESC